jgi:hypothetical protein
MGRMHSDARQVYLVSCTILQGFTADVTVLFPAARLCDTVAGGLCDKLRPTGLSAAENVRGIRFDHTVLAPNSWPDYQALFGTARIQLMDCWQQQLSRQQYALIRKEAPSIGGE